MTASARSPRKSSVRGRGAAGKEEEEEDELTGLFTFPVRVDLRRAVAERVPTMTRPFRRRSHLLRGSRFMLVSQLRRARHTAAATHTHAAAIFFLVSISLSLSFTGFLFHTTTFIFGT